MLNITDKSVEDNIVPVLRLGFRPFFLLGSLYAMIAIGIWVYAFQYGQPTGLQVPALWWHVHEMYFGFAMAIVAGFLLTAVQNWTGINGVKNRRLALLAGLWLLPRLLFWTHAPLWLISSIESLFLALVAFEVAFRVIKVKGYRNVIFLPLFLLAIVANFASYATIKGMPPFPSIAVWQAMLWWFVLLISIMGGRVIPFFTARRFGFEKPQPRLWLDSAANIPLALLFILSFFPLTHATLSPAILLFAAVVQWMRWLRWRPWRTLKEPLVWSLHFTYACLPVGLLIEALAEWQLIPNGEFVSHTMLHLMAIGGIGGLILAMIVRVTMGHTGRMIYQGPNMWFAFMAILLAALLRGVGVSFWPQHMLLMINLAAAFWILAFGLFIVKFGFMLIRPRADGHPG